MRKRYITFRVSDAEHQALKAEAEKAGTSVPVHARRLALESVQIGPRLDALERRFEAVPDREMLIEIARRLAAKIDRAGNGKAGAP